MSATTGLPVFHTYLAEVVGGRDVHPTLREVTVAGHDLVGFTSLGPDTFLHLLLPPPGRAELTIGHDFTWEAAFAMPEEERPVGAYYTVRRARPEAGELDLHVVLHDPRGHASAWAERAVAGDPLALWGPRTCWEPPAATTDHLLVADETGLPTVAAALETLPASATIHVVAEVEDAAARVALPEHPGAAVTWLHRDGAPPGTPGLVDAVRDTPLAEDTTYAYGGGESRAMTAVRRHLRRERGLSREAVSMVAYWRHSATPDEDVDDD